jgi:3'(2'), 5'-bisphosphate nucleotidase
MTDRDRELAVALRAVRTAARACRAVSERLIDDHTLEKKDQSPVTVADFASQALVCAVLQEAFPHDAVVAEEDSAELRTDEQSRLRAAVAERVGAELGHAVDEARVLGWIDRGGAKAGSGRYWTLDPIDGTKGFLRGEQYAVALGLIEDGEVVVGALACPNLPLAGEGSPLGALFSALRGAPARIHPLWTDGEGTPVRVAAARTAAEARFCESVESSHSNQDESAEIAKALGIRTPPLRIDSQCKYAAVARGDASIYLRMPTRKDYREKIWDHAAGKLVVEAAGGRVTDIDGTPLDFTCGRALENNRGVVATSGAIHDEVIDAIRRVRA